MVFVCFCVFCRRIEPSRGHPSSTASHTKSILTSGGQRSPLTIKCLQLTSLCSTSVLLSDTSLPHLLPVGFSSPSDPECVSGVVLLGQVMLVLCKFGLWGVYILDQVYRLLYPIHSWECKHPSYQGVKWAMVDYIATKHQPAGKVHVDAKYYPGSE